MSGLILRPDVIDKFSPQHVSTSGGVNEVWEIRKGRCNIRKAGERVLLLTSGSAHRENTWLAKYVGEWVEDTQLDTDSFEANLDKIRVSLAAARSILKLPADGTGDSKMRAWKFTNVVAMSPARLYPSKELRSKARYPFRP